MGDCMREDDRRRESIERVKAVSIKYFCNHFVANVKIYVMKGIQMFAYLLD